MDKPSEGKNAAKIANKGKLIAFESLQAPALPEEDYSFQATVVAPTEAEVARGMPCLFACCRDEPIADAEMFESFLNHPPLESMENAP